VKATRQAMEKLSDWAEAKIKAGEIEHKPSEATLTFYGKLMDSIEGACNREVRPTSAW